MAIKRMLGIVLVLLLAGCGTSGPEAPKTYATKGKVVFKDGQPFRGGIISFTLKADPTQSMDSEIGDDGSFRLGTVFNNQRLDGAREGDYEVMVSSKFNANQGVAIYVLPKLVTIEPKENELTIEVDPSTFKR